MENVEITPKLKKYGIIAILVVVALIAFSFVNPFSWNDAGNRTVV